MIQIPYVAPMDDVRYGSVEQLSPLVQRVLAENPGKYTYRGTGTYIVGTIDVVVIDPGPRIESHQVALTRAIYGRNVVGIVVTHCHADHSPLSSWLKQHTGALTYAYGSHGVTPDLEEVTENEASNNEDKVDRDFVPDVFVCDGDMIIGTAEFSMYAVHTPGHTSNHLCVDLPEEQTLFTGDHVMGWSTTVIAPPDGDMAAYMTSLHKVANRSDQIWRPTHGNPIEDTDKYVEALITHRTDRENQIIGCLTGQSQTIDAIVKVLYADVREELHAPAGRSVLAHLIKLFAEGRVNTTTAESPRRDSVFVLAAP